MDVAKSPVAQGTESSFAALLSLDQAGRWAGRVLVALVLLNILLLAYYIGWGYRLDFHSDSALKNLLAQEILDTGRYFPKDWNYVNGDLWVLFGQLFVLPFAPMFPNGFMLHAVAGWIAAALILWGVWLVTGIFAGKRWTRLMTVAIFAGAISWQGAENLYGQVSYGSVFGLGCFILFAAWRFLGTATPWRSGVVFALLVVVGFWSNPQRAAAYYLLPLCAALFVSEIFQLRSAGAGWRKALARPCMLLALLATAGVCGIIAHKITLQGVSNIPGVGSTRWLSFDDMMRNFGLTIRGLLAILGAVPHAGDSVMKVSGLIDGVRLISALILLALIPRVLLDELTSGHPGGRFVATFAATGLALFIVLQVATTTPDMGDPESSSRYMFPWVMFAIIVFVHSTAGRLKGLMSVMAGFVLVVLLLSAVTPANPLSRPLYGAPKDQRAELAEFLYSKGLRYGYATYWNAGATTVLANQKVRIRQVLLNDGMPVPFRHLSSNRWFEPNYWTGSTFLLLTAQEASALSWDRIEKFAGKPSQVLQHGDFTAYVFPSNLASRLPGWSNPVAFELLEIPEPRQRIGSRTREGQATVLVSERQQAGFLHFGPYLSLPPGHYRASAEVDTVDSEAANGVAGGLDVIAASDDGVQLIAAAPIATRHRGVVALEFSLEHTVRDAEVRISTTGASRTVLRRLTLRRIGDAAPVR